MLACLSGLREPSYKRERCYQCPLDGLPAQVTRALALDHTCSFSAHLLPVRYQHDLTDHASASQQFVCEPRLAEKQPLCDQRLDLFLLQ